MPPTSRTTRPRLGAAAVSGVPPRRFGTGVSSSVELEARLRMLRARETPKGGAEQFTTVHSSHRGVGDLDKSYFLTRPDNDSINSINYNHDYAPPPPLERKARPG